MQEKRIPSNKIIWTEEMEQFIRDNYKTMNDIELGKVLFVSEHSIIKKRRTMKINRAEKRRIPEEVVKYAIDLVRNGESYPSAANKCSVKFNTKINTSTIANKCEEAGVYSKNSNKNFMASRGIEDKYKGLEKYNTWLNNLKNKIQVGDKIDVIQSGAKIVIAKYPNFVMCINSGIRETIPYTDIKKILVSKREEGIMCVKS